MPAKTSTTKAKKAPSKAEAARRAKQASTSASGPTAATPRHGAGWQRGGGRTGPTVLSLPSGNSCLVIEPSPEALIEAGVLDKLDVLSKLVHDDLVEPAKKGMGGQRRLTVKNEDGEEQSITIEQLFAITEFADRVTALAVIDPVVALTPTPSCLQEGCDWENNDPKTHAGRDHDLQLRPLDPNVVYTDTIDFEDKLAVTEYMTGGARGLARFLQQPDPSVGSVESEQNVEAAPEPDSQD